MTSAASRLRMEEENGVISIEFEDRNILDESTIREIGKEIIRLVEERDRPRVVLSFEHVDFLSSSVLGTLITINKKIHSRGGELRLSNINPQIYEVFEITDLYKLFSIHETKELAVASIAG